MEMCPQRLKPGMFSIAYVRAEAGTLQRTEFFRSLFGLCQGAFCAKWLCKDNSGQGKSAFCWLEWGTQLFPRDMGA
jgi:hypothetical protein